MRGSFEGINRFISHWVIGMHLKNIVARQKMIKVVKLDYMLQRNDDKMKSNRRLRGP